jgi:hypothetical protein
VVKKKSVVPDRRSLEQLEPLVTYHNPKTVAFKTVDIFAGIIQRKLWLQHDDTGPARTDGNCITVNLDDEDMYRKVEHELSHILFQSDFAAKSHFVINYSDRAIAFAKQHGQTLDVAKVQGLVDFTINVIEDCRVDSLWGMLYPGSEMLQKKLNRRITQSYAGKCHTSYLLYFACVAGGAVTPPGPMDVYRPLFEQALRQVVRRGFQATLVLSKWLITNLLAEIVRQTVARPLAPSTADSGLLSEGPHQSSPGGQAPATPEQRVAAVVEVLKNCAVPVDLRAQKDDLQPAAYPERGAAGKAKATAEAAAQVDVGDEAQMRRTLEDTQGAMDAIIDRVQAAIRPPVTPDEWIRKDSEAKVLFHDVQLSDLRGSEVPMSPEDRETVLRLRALFLRVMGRRRSTLDDSGVEVDVPAFIERQVNKVPVPCFKQEQRGRGFETLILLDRSSSMAGRSTEQAERACRVIGRALLFPFVRTSLWGFQSLAAGQVDIARYASLGTRFSSSKSTVKGHTPLHAALRLGVRFLERGSGAKQIIVVTDGHPCYEQKGKSGGVSVPTSQLQYWVRDAVHTAQRRGVTVTCLMIGSQVSRQHLQRMFGAEANWRVLSRDRLGADMVRVMVSSFVKFLKTR